MAMEIILREDVQHLGKAGEVVKVKDGYARNYLLPHGLAYTATEANKKRITFEANRLERDVQVKQEVYLTLTREYEQARIAEVRDTPLLTIVDRAVPPYKKSSPHRLLMVIAALVIGVVLAAWLTYTRALREHAEGTDRMDYLEFRDASRRAWIEFKALVLGTIGRKAKDRV